MYRKAHVTGASGGLGQTEGRDTKHLAIKSSGKKPW